MTLVTAENIREGLQWGKGGGGFQIYNKYALNIWIYLKSLATKWNL